MYPSTLSSTVKNWHSFTCRFANHHHQPIETTLNRMTTHDKKTGTKITKTHHQKAATTIIVTPQFNSQTPGEEYNTIGAPVATPHLQKSAGANVMGWSRNSLLKTALLMMMLHGSKPLHQWWWYDENISGDDDNTSGRRISEEQCYVVGTQSELR